jgi:hypothetical protein
MSTSETPVLPVAATAAPAQKLTAIQIIEQDLLNFFQQKEKAVANVHAVEGAIQATQYLLAKLKAEEKKAETFVEAEVSKGIAVVKELL